MSNLPDIEIQHQTVFGADGPLEVTETSVEASIEDFGADVDHRERDSRLDCPVASEFDVDDRPAVTRSTVGDQPQLFADTADDQQTLNGETVSGRCLYDNELSEQYLDISRWHTLASDVVICIATAIAIRVHERNTTMRRLPG